jgi:hypothetical protein
MEPSDFSDRGLKRQLTLNSGAKTQASELKPKVTCINDFDYEQHGSDWVLSD